MKLRIDLDRCQGHGRCWEVAPSLIESDDVGRGMVVVTDISDADVGVATMAVHACPERAVLLEE